jgi:adenine deaminase
MPDAARMESSETLVRLFDAAQGITNPDLVIRNCRVVNVFTGELEATNIQVAAGRIVGLDPTQDYGSEVIDAGGLCDTWFSRWTHAYRGDAIAPI